MHIYTSDSLRGTAETNTTAREGRDLGVAFQARPGSQASSRVEAKVHALGKEMATHSSVHAWKIPGTGEPGGLPSMGSHRVGHD